MSDCQMCPVEKRCDYEYKPCDCVHQRKFVQIELKPYQVGENDIVVAKNEMQAKQLLIDYCGGDLKLDELEAEDLSDRLSMAFQDEEGNNIGTLGGWTANIVEPQYLVGWE